METPQLEELSGDGIPRSGPRQISPANERQYYLVPLPDGFRGYPNCNR